MNTKVVRHLPERNKLRLELTATQREFKRLWNRIDQLKRLVPLLYEATEVYDGVALNLETAKQESPWGGLKVSPVSANHWRWACVCKTDRDWYGFPAGSWYLSIHGSREDGILTSDEYVGHWWKKSEAITAAKRWVTRGVKPKGARY